MRKVRGGGMEKYIIIIKKYEPAHPRPLPAHNRLASVSEARRLGGRFDRKVKCGRSKSSKQPKLHV